MNGGLTALILAFFDFIDERKTINQSFDIPAISNYAYLYCTAGGYSQRFYHEDHPITIASTYM